MSESPFCCNPTTPSDVSSPSAIKNPNKDLLVPKWLNNEYFHKILAKDLPKFKSIQQLTTTAATAPGENYASFVFRSYITAQLEDGSTTPTSYIVKCGIKEPGVYHILSQLNTFPKEKEMYQKIIPQFEKLYADAGMDITFAPSCKYTEDNDNRSVMVLEDLKWGNFKNVDRLLGFDLEHMEFVLKKVAELHAVSAVHYQKFGPYSKMFSESFYEDKNMPFFRASNQLKYNQYQQVLPMWKDCDKYLKCWPTPEWLLSWMKKYETPSPDNFMVLNHGDCWSNNIMFQYTEEGLIKEMKFVDFQMCMWGPPTRDLFYLITMSSNYDIRITHFDRFLRIYQQNLAKNLKLLNYSRRIPSLKDIQKWMIQDSLYSFHTAQGVMSVILMDPDKEANLSNYFNDEKFRLRAVMNPRYVKTMKQLLPWWENRGAFEHDE